jgi:hypothetical protein
MRTVRTVEQGMGRSVRGEKDYSVIVVTGSDMVRLIREKATRRFLSPQVDKQIQIGLAVAEMARQEVADGEDPAKAFSLTYWDGSALASKRNRSSMRSTSSAAP